MKLVLSSIIGFVLLIITSTVTFADCSAGSVSPLKLIIVTLSDDGATFDMTNSKCNNDDCNTTTSNTMTFGPNDNTENAPSNTYSTSADYSATLKLAAPSKNGEVTINIDKNGTSTYASHHCGSCYITGFQDDPPQTIQITVGKCS